MRAVCARVSLTRRGSRTELQEEKEAERKQKERLKRDDRLIESKREWLAVLSNWDKR